MKLTEQELAQVFQESTSQSVQAANVSDCLNAPNVIKAESVVSDFYTAQATKLAIHMKPWCQHVGHDLSTSQRTSWLHRVNQLFAQWLPHSPFAISALAVVFTFSAVLFLSNHQALSPTADTDMVTNDVINSLPFEGNNDRLSKGGFDEPAEKDRLFNANFS